METGTAGTLYIVSAASGAGKTSLLRALMKGDDRLCFSVSHTTRQPRSGERDGHDYHFVDDAAFQALVEADAFLEHAHVFDRRYGTSWAAIDEDLAAGRDVLVEIDWQGARQIRERMPGCVSIFVLPPSRGALEERLRGRGQDSDDVIAARMAAAVDEMSHCTEYDYIIWNDDFAVALADLQAVIRARRLHVTHQRIMNGEALSALIDADSRHG
ncbi:guanylate kinase [Spiribacter vilamensis]|nr:guanylate kinase [Spiribacter vilamensis]